MTTPRLKPHFQLIQLIRDFFVERGFLDVLTPPMVTNPGMETHIHPFSVHHTKTPGHSGRYLHTSPEFHMKELLSEGFEKIFTISYCFRDEPRSPEHREQFLMLEWYRANERYEQIMDDCEELFRFCQQGLKQDSVKLSPVRMTIQELFLKVINIDILNYLDKDTLRRLLESNFSDIPLPSDPSSMSWDDYYFLLFLNKVEPTLKQYPFILLYEFPAPLAALSTLKKEDPRVCERFEIYSNGIELCNCFNELTDLEIQKKRFSNQADEKSKLYGYELPEAEVLYKAMEKGLPCSAGIALGVERLLMVLTDNNNPFWE